MMIGNPDTGKTYLTIELGIRNCKEKYKVRCYTAANLVTELVETRDDHRLNHLEQKLEKMGLLIVDKPSSLTLSKSQSELLSHLLSIRNERGSVIITTNLEFSRWGELFPDSMLTATLIDRLTHHAHTFNINGEPYRFKQRLSKETGGFAMD